METPWTTVRLLSQPELADRAGLAPQTIRVYKSRGELPAPDLRIGGTDGWTEATADAWIDTLPGRGHRTDIDVAALLRDHPDTVTLGGGTVEILWDREWTRGSWHDPHAWHVERGTCARIAAARHPSTHQPETPYGWITSTWHGMPTWISGIPDAELGRAVRILAATARAYAAHEQVRADHAARTLATLRALRAEYDGLPRGARHAHAVQQAERKLRWAVAAALGEQLLDPADLAAASGLTEAQVQALAHDLDD